MLTNCIVIIIFPFLFWNMFGIRVKLGLKYVQGHLLSRNGGHIMWLELAARSRRDVVVWPTNVFREPKERFQRNCWRNGVFTLVWTFRTSNKTAMEYEPWQDLLKTAHQVTDKLPALPEHGDFWGNTATVTMLSPIFGRITQIAPS